MTSFLHLYLSCSLTESHLPAEARFINQAVVTLNPSLVGGRIRWEELGFSAFTPAYIQDFNSQISGGIDREARAACLRQLGVAYPCLNGQCQ